MLHPWLAWYRLLSSPAMKHFNYCLWDYLLGLYLVKNSSKSQVQPYLILLSVVLQDFTAVCLRLSK